MSGDFKDSISIDPRAHGEILIIPLFTRKKLQLAGKHPSYKAKSELKTVADPPNNPQSRAKPFAQG
jgi:hypothetical protein